MRILFTTQLTDLAGSGYSLMYLMKGLAQKGHEIHLACPGGSFIEQLIKDIPIRIHSVPFRSYFDFPSIMRLDRIIKENQIELVNPQLGKDRTLAIWAKLFSALQFKLVFTRRQVPRDEPWLKRKIHLLKLDKMVVISAELKRLFLKKGYPEDIIEVIENGIPLDLGKTISKSGSERLRKQYGLDGFVVGCVARRKKQDQLIRALRFLPSDVQLLFVGINEEDCKSVLEKEKPDHKIIFTGPLDHTACLYHYPLMNVHVLPSTMDGFGLSTAEAMAFGVPVIGTDYGGIKSVIDHGKSGLLFRDGAIQELATCIMDIRNQSKLKDQLITNAKLSVEVHFNTDRMVQAYEQLFLNLLSIE